MFDHLYLTLAGLPARLGPGMLVLAGDVFLVFDHRHVTAPPPGVTAITMRVDADLGRGHGVLDARQATRLRARLAERSGQPGSTGAVYAMRINREGLRVKRRRAGRTSDS